MVPICINLHQLAVSLIGQIKISYNNNRCYTVNIDIFRQFIFSPISRSAVNVQKYDASEKRDYDGKN